MSHVFSYQDLLQVLTFILGPRSLQGEWDGGEKAHEQVDTRELSGIDTCFANEKLLEVDGGILPTRLLGDFSIGN